MAFIEYLDRWSHKYFDDYVYFKRPGHRAVYRIQNFICDQLDKYYV